MTCIHSFVLLLSVSLFFFFFSFCCGTMTSITFHTRVIPGRRSEEMKYKHSEWAVCLLPHGGVPFFFSLTFTPPQSCLAPPRPPSARVGEGGNSLADFLTSWSTHTHMEKKTMFQGWNITPVVPTGSHYRPANYPAAWRGLHCQGFRLKLAPHMNYDCRWDPPPSPHLSILVSFGVYRHLFHRSRWIAEEAAVLRL